VRASYRPRDEHGEFEDDMEDMARIAEERLKTLPNYN
jgi:hypothetical protein